MWASLKNKENVVGQREVVPDDCLEDFETYAAVSFDNIRRRLVGDKRLGTADCVNCQEKNWRWAHGSADPVVAEAPEPDFADILVKKGNACNVASGTGGTKSLT